MKILIFKACVHCSFCPALCLSPSLPSLFPSLSLLPPPPPLLLLLPDSSLPLVSSLLDQQQNRLSVRSACFETLLSASHFPIDI